MTLAIPTSLHRIVVSIAESHLEVRDVAHEELPERNVPAVQLERLLGISLASFEVRGKTFREKPSLNPREDIRTVNADAFRLMVALLVSQ